MKADVSIIGSGSWATAIVKMLTPNVSSIAWYIREEDIIRHIKGHNHNPRYLSTVNLNTEKLQLTNSINDAIQKSDILIFVIPSAFLKDELTAIKNDLSGKIICSAIKGIVPESNSIVGDFFHNEYQVSYDNLVVLTGPSHAEEVAMEKLTYLTVASLNEYASNSVASLIKNHYIRTILSDDIVGTEYAAVIKNIYAIASGIAIGLGFGDNFLAVLLSNALSEMKSFIKAVYKTDRDINSSPYLGDLLVTGYSRFSRNRMFGTMIGKGYSVRFTQMEMDMVAEGYYASDCINKINIRAGAKIPIADTVYRILYEGANPSTEYRKLTELLK